MKTGSATKKMLSAALMGLLVPLQTVRADEQRLAPGTGSQGLLQVHTGSNGICETDAQGDDFQLAPLGGRAPNQPAVKCEAGGGTVDTSAAGDDVQLVASGNPCTNNQVIVDTGANGIADTTAAGNDVQVQAPGTSPANAPCVGVGPNGIADTPDPVGGDDVRQQAYGTGNANAAVVRCGPNLVVDTPANSFNPVGDDVQVVGVGTTCANANVVVVNAGPNGIADTRAFGPDLLVKAARKLTLSLPKGRPFHSKKVKVVVRNVEFGSTAPASRSFKLVVDDGSCPNGSVSQVDADNSTPGLQATANVPKDGKVTAAFVVTFRAEQVNTVSRGIPERCEIDVTAVVDEPNFTENDPDDDRGTEDNNRTQVTVEVVDKNDL